MDTALLLFFAIIVLSYTVQTVTGFGSMVVCVTFGAQFMTIPEILTLALPLSMLQTGYIAIRHRDGIDWRLLGRDILPIMGVGVIGIRFVLTGQPGAWLRTAFGALVLVLAVRELVTLLRHTGAPAAQPLPRPAHLGAILGAGVIHGIYATGGPLLVYAVGRLGLDKHRFRSTLSVVWLTLNAVLIVTFVWDGRYDVSSAVDIAWLLPAIPIGIVAGELLHRRVDERRFKLSVFSLLSVAALTLLFR